MTADDPSLELHPLAGPEIAICRVDQDLQIPRARMRRYFRAHFTIKKHGGAGRGEGSFNY